MSQRQTKTAMIVGIMYGKSATPRRKSQPGKRRCRISAPATPATICSMVLATAYTVASHTLRQKSGSTRSCA